MWELVCPEFYVDEWQREGARYTEEDNDEYPFAADDGVCRIEETVTNDGTDEGTLFRCRCGMLFSKVEAQRVPVRR